jgi:prepilin-type processing-associated H-X9-DG protein
MARPSRSIAFSLVELLVVIVIIGILLLLMFPALYQVRETARRMTCGNNLFQIGRAYSQYGMRYAGGPAGGAKAISVGTWMTTLLPFLDGARSTYFCPSDDEFNLTGPTVDAYCIEVKNTGSQIYLKEGPWTTVFKYPSSDWDKFTTDHAARAWGGAKITDYAPNVQPQSSNAYVVACDDWTPVCDSSTMCILVDPDGDETRCTYRWSSPTGYSYRVKDPAGNVIVKYFEVGTSFTAPGGDKCSYGMNSRAVPFSQDSHKILMVEYCHVVADVVGPTSHDLFPTHDMKDSPYWGGWGGSRARHLKQMNVLFAGGNVEPRSPMAINPVNAESADRYWQPLLDQPK